MSVLADAAKQDVSVSRDLSVPETDPVFGTKNAVCARNDGDAPQRLLLRHTFFVGSRLRFPSNYLKSSISIVFGTKGGRTRF